MYLYSTSFHPSTLTSANTNWDSSSIENIAAMPILVVVRQKNLERSILSSLINQSVKVFPLFDHRSIMLERSGFGYLWSFWQDECSKWPITHDIIYFSNISSQSPISSPIPSRSPISSLIPNLFQYASSLIRQISFNLPAKKDSLSRSCNVAGMTTCYSWLSLPPCRNVPYIAPHKLMWHTPKTAISRLIFYAFFPGSFLSSSNCRSQ